MRLERGGEGEHFGENRAWCQVRRIRRAESWSGECGKQSGRSSGMDSGSTGPAALKQSNHEFLAIIADKLSFVICLGHLFLPKPFRCSMVLEYLFLLTRIVELDLIHAFAHPVEKEPGRSFADSTRRRANLDVKGTCRGKTECVGHVRDCSY